MTFNINNTEIESETTEKTTDDDKEEQNDFYNWLDEHIERKRNSVLKLKTICELYIKRQNIHSSFNGERFKGWVGLQLKHIY